MGKLAKFSESVERFLQAAAKETGLKNQKNQWLADNFTNESVAFDGSFATAVSEPISARFIEMMDAVTGNDPLAACHLGLVTQEVVAEFSQIGHVLDPDDNFLVGIYRNGSLTDADWRTITYRKSADVRLLLEARITTWGSLQGVIYAWHPLATPPFIWLREASTGRLINCQYKPKVYSRIHAATNVGGIVVHVYGDIDWDGVTNTIARVLIDDIEVADPLSDGEFERLFGSLPSITGDEKTADYLSRARQDGE